MHEIERIESIILNYICAKFNKKFSTWLLCKWVKIQI